MDFKTLIIAALAVSLATNLSMAIVFWTRRTYAGFGYWLAGTCFRTLAALPFLLPRDQFPPWLTIVLPNYLMLVELLLYLRGTLIFRGRTVRIGWEIAASLSFIALFVWSTYLRPDYGARLLVISFYHTLIELLILQVLLTRRPPYFGSIDRWQAGIFGLLVTAVLVRVGYLWMVIPPTPQLAMPPVYLNEWVLILILSQLLIALSFILMNAQRLEYDYRQSQRQLEEDIRKR